MHQGSINVNTYKSSFFYFAHSARTNIKLVFYVLCYLCLGLRLTHQDLWEIEKNHMFQCYFTKLLLFFLKCSFGHVSVSLMCSSVHQLSFCLLSFFMFFCFFFLWEITPLQQLSLLLDFGKGDIPLSNFASAYANKQSSAPPHFRPMSRIFQPPLKRPKTS